MNRLRQSHWVARGSLAFMLSDRQVWIENCPLKNAATGQSNRVQ
jgi:hypothetical protein